MDFPHPLNFYFLVDRDSIQPTNNQNSGNVDDPKINDELDRLDVETDARAVADDWAALDEYLIAPPQSYIAPYGHGLRTNFLRRGSISMWLSSTRSTSTTTRVGLSRRASRSRAAGGTTDERFSRRHLQPGLKERARRDA